MCWQNSPNNFISNSTKNNQKAWSEGFGLINIKYSIALHINPSGQ
jgi:hypothetical protein